MKQLHTEIDIDAAPEVVWEVLADLAAYGEWNPFIVEVQGELEVGAKLRVRLAPPGGRALTVRPRVTEAVSGSSFEWLGRLAVPGLFTGRHRFEIHPTSNGTKVVHTETFTGVLVALLARSLDTHTLAGFRAMNGALKARAERQVAPV
jgi:hypothetical protein